MSLGRRAVDGGGVGDEHRAPREVEPLLAMIGVRRRGAPIKSRLGQTSTASPVRTSDEMQLRACACNRRSTRRRGELAAPVGEVPTTRSCEGPRRSLEQPPDQREDPLVMKAAMLLGVVERAAARLRPGSKLRQQERDGQLPNPPLQRTTAGCNSGSMVNMWSRRRGLGPRLLATKVLSTITHRRR
jgi:hypothetical protein